MLANECLCAEPELLYFADQRHFLLVACCLQVHVDTENGSITVVARTAEAASAARSLLELTEQTLHIPSVLVGRVVGKNFSIIKEIEQHSGVLRIKVGLVILT